MSKRRLPWLHAPYLPDPLGPCPNPGAEAVAERWARWVAERDGIAWPELPSAGWSQVVKFDNTGPDHPRWCCEVWDQPNRAEHWRWYVTRKRRTVTELPDAVCVLKFPVPPWVVPCKRADLWHAAHQAGQDFEECYAEGQGWRAATERAEKANATRWANKREAREASRQAEREARRITELMA